MPPGNPLPSALLYIVYIIRKNDYLQRLFEASFTKHTSGGGAMNDILGVIRALREQRGWTEYQLAEQSGLPQSTISSWYRKNMVPTVSSLEKICGAYGITPSQLFAHGEESVSLTPSQKKLPEHWSKLSPEQQAALPALLEQM